MSTGAWKGLVQHEGITGTTAVDDWAGVENTMPAAELMVGDMTGVAHLDEGQVPENWAGGTLNWVWLTEQSGGGSKAYGHFYTFALNENQTCKLGPDSDGTVFTNNQWNMESGGGGSFAQVMTNGQAIPVMRQGNAGGFVDKQASGWAPIFRDLSFSASMGGTGDNYDDHTLNQDENDIGNGVWSIIQNVDLAQVSITGKPGALFITSAEATTTEGGTYHTPIIAAKAPSFILGGGAIDYQGPFHNWANNEASANHIHATRYLESAAPSGAVERLVYTQDLKNDGIQGIVYLGPDQYVGTFTDDGGDKWFYYSFFRQYQNGNQKFDYTGNGSNEASTKTGDYYYQLGGTNAGTTTVGASTEMNDMFGSTFGQAKPAITYFDPSSTTANDMSIPFPGGTRMLCWSDAQLAAIKSRVQELNATASNQVLLAAIQLNDSAGTWKMSGYDASHATGGAALTITSKYAYPYFYHSVNNSYLTHTNANDSTATKTSIRYFYHSDAELSDHNSICEDEGGQAVVADTTKYFGSNGAGTLFDDSSDNFKVVGRFFLVKVANVGNTTVPGTNIADTHDHAQKLFFRLQNLRRVNVQDQSVAWSGNDVTPNGSKLTIDNAEAANMSFALSSSLGSVNDVELDASVITGHSAVITTTTSIAGANISDETNDSASPLASPYYSLVDCAGGDSGQCIMIGDGEVEAAMWINSATTSEDLSADMDVSYSIEVSGSPDGQNDRSGTLAMCDIISAVGEDNILDLHTDILRYSPEGTSDDLVTLFGSWQDGGNQLIAPRSVSMGAVLTAAPNTVNMMIFPGDGLNKDAYTALEAGLSFDSIEDATKGSLLDDTKVFMWIPAA